MTAQFVARNGQRFLTGLSEREAKNTQFDFLKPQHNLFGYFTYLVESYSKCLLPKKEEQIKLNNLANDRNIILRRSTDRYLWEKKSKENQKKKDKVDELEKLQMAQIDWYDFVVVDIVEFTEEELNNTVPITSNNQNANINISSFSGNVNILLNKDLINYNNGVEVNGTAVINTIAGIPYTNDIVETSNTIENKNKNANDVQILDENEVINNSKKLLGLAAFEKENRIAQENSNKIKAPIPSSTAINIEPTASNIANNLVVAENINEINKTPIEPGIKVVTNYKRKPDTKAVSNVKKSEMQKCPLCSENIPVDDLSHHMKIELLDPKWKEINKEITERKMELSLAPASDFINYLGEFARDRPDLFGDDVNDIIKIEEWKKLETKYNMQHIKWDGFAPNMSRTTANIAMLAQQTKKNYEESRKMDKMDGINPTIGLNKETSFNNPNISNTVIQSGNISGVNPNVVPIGVVQQAPILNTTQTSGNLSNMPLKNTNSDVTGSGSIAGADIQSKKLLDNLISEDAWIRKYPVNNIKSFFFD